MNLAWTIAAAAFLVGALDALTTHIGLKTPGLEELNPLWRGLYARTRLPVFFMVMAFGQLLLSVGALFLLGPVAQHAHLVVGALAPAANLLVILRARRKAHGKGEG